MNTVLGYGKLVKLVATETASTNLALFVAAGFARTAMLAGSLFTKCVKDAAAKIRLNDGLSYLNNCVPESIREWTDFGIANVKKNIEIPLNMSYTEMGANLLKTASLTSVALLALRHVASNSIVVNTTLNGLNVAQRWVFSKN